LGGMRRFKYYLEKMSQR